MATTRLWTKAPRKAHMVYLLKMVIFHGKLLVITREYMETENFMEMSAAMLVVTKNHAVVLRCFFSFIHWPSQEPIDWRYLPYIRPV